MATPPYNTYKKATGFFLSRGMEVIQFQNKKTATGSACSRGCRRFTVRSNYRATGALREGTRATPPLAASRLLKV